MLRVNNIETYYGQVKALKGVSLHVGKGETVALLGANGAGKTTLLRAITGLNTVSTGQILLEDQDITNMRTYKITQLGVAMSPEGRQVFPNFSVRENLEAGAYSLNDDKMKKELMEEVYQQFPRLRERVNQPAGTLSGGEQQMLAMGRAMMSNPRILLLDEPSMGLAPKIVEQIFEIISLFKEQGRTILLVEQNAMASLRLADRGYIIETGRIVLEGDSTELLGNPEVKAKYLGT